MILGVEMGRLRDLVANIDWSDQGQRLAGWLNPVVASPAAPLETFAAMDAVGSSLTSRRALRVATKFRRSARRPRRPRPPRSGPR